MRHVTQSYTQTVTLGAGQTVHVPWTFEVGRLVTGRAGGGQPTRRKRRGYDLCGLIIDSRWVPVIEDPVRLAGERQAQLPGRRDGPPDHASAEAERRHLCAGARRDRGRWQPLLWSNLTLTGTYTITNPTRWATSHRLPPAGDACAAAATTSSTPTTSGVHVAHRRPRRGLVH